MSRSHLLRLASLMSLFIVGAAVIDAAFHRGMNRFLFDTSIILLVAGIQYFKTRRAKQ